MEPLKQPVVFGSCSEDRRPGRLAVALRQRGWSCQFLPAPPPQDEWGAIWDGWIRYLEELAPCVFVNFDHWESNAIVARLSSRVTTIGLFYEPSEEIARLGHFYNAICVPDEALRFEICSRQPQLAARLFSLRPGVTQSSRPPARSAGSPLNIICPDQALDRPDQELLERLLNHPASFAVSSARDAHLLLSSPGNRASLIEGMGNGLIPIATSWSHQQSLVPPDAQMSVESLLELALHEDRRLAIAQTMIDTSQSLNTWAANFEDLILQLFRRTTWRRQRTWMHPSLRQLQEKPDSAWTDSLAYVNHTVLWPDAASPPAVSQANRMTRMTRPVPEYKIIVAAGGGQISGVDIFSSHLVQGLLSLGYDARILGERAGAHAQSLPFCRTIPVDSLKLLPTAGLPELWEATRAYLESQAPCVFLPNYEFTQASIVPQLSSGVKVLAIGHSDDPTHYEQIMRIGPYCDGIATVSRAIARHVEGLNSSLGPRLRVIPYGVDVPACPRPDSRLDGPLKILYAGRFVDYQKRTTDLILIAHWLKQHGIPFQLSLIGEGILRQHLADQIEAVGLQNDVLLLGKRDNLSLLQEMQHHHVLLLPSSFEGLPVALLEGMAQGLAPVVSRIRSGIPDLLEDRTNCLLSPVGDIASFGEQLARLSKEPHLLSRISRAAWHTVRTGPYSREVMVSTYVEMLNHLWKQSYQRPSGAVLPPPYAVSKSKIDCTGWPAKKLKLALQAARDWSHSLG